MSRVKALLQNVEDAFAQVLGGRYLSGKFRPQIQVHVIEALEDFAGYGRVELSQVANHSGSIINLAADRHLKSIIMPVPMRVVAFPVDGAVLFFRQLIAMKSMRCGEDVA